MAKKQYIVFNNFIESAEANGRLIYECYKNNTKILKSNPDKHAGFDFGKKLKDGRVACRVPPHYKNIFKGNLESIDDADFLEVDNNAI